MKRSLLPLLFALLLASCAEREVVGKGSTGSENRAISGAFSKIDISAPIEVRITVGGQQAVYFDGYTNLVKEIHTEVKGQTLRIFVDEGVDFETDKPVLAVISVPSLSALGLSGSVKAGVGPLTATAFNLDMSGACAAEFAQLQVQNFSADMSGSSKLVMSNGAIATGEYDISGSGEITAFGVSHNKAAIGISGSGEADITAEQSLDVEVSGSGSIRYKGHPKVTQDISGSGEVRDAN